MGFPASGKAVPDYASFVLGFEYGILPILPSFYEETFIAPQNFIMNLAARNGKGNILIRFNPDEFPPPPP